MPPPTITPREAISHTTDEKSHYLLISLPLAAPLSEPDKDLIVAIERTCKNNGFFFEINERALHFYLKSLDPDRFKKDILDLLGRGKDRKVDSPRMHQLFLELFGRIESIKSYGIKGKKRIYVDYNKERKVENRQHKIKKRGACYYALNHEFDRTTNALQEEYRNTILAGDSEAELRRLPSNCIDLIITSPPYNFGLGYDTSEDGVDWEGYFGKLFAVFDECIRVLKYGGRIIVNIQPLFSDYIPSHHIISHYFMQKQLIWKGEILWEKNNYNCKYTAWGSWKSPSNPYLKYTWEFLEIFAKGDLKKEGLRENIDISADEFKKWVVAKWSIAPEKKMTRYDHPAMFPEELVMRALKLFSYEGDIILDPFNGVGTTCVVAKRMNRNYLGIDISQKYCDIAERRLKEILPITT